MSNILSDFGNMLQGQFGLIGAKADATAQRSYTEEGFFATNPYNPTPKLSEIIGETPDITVLVKKRAFSSLPRTIEPILWMHENMHFIEQQSFCFSRNAC